MSGFAARCLRRGMIFFCTMFEINKTQTIFEPIENNSPLRYTHKVQIKQKRKEITNMAKIADMVEKMGESVSEGYKKIEDGVVSGYKKIETGAVEGFGKVSDKMVETFFVKEGESVEDAKKRLSGKE